DFYRVFAFFNNVPENGKAIKYGNSPPLIRAPTRRQQEQLRRLNHQLADAGACFARLAPELDAAQAKWEKSTASPSTPARKGVDLDSSPTANLLAHFTLDGDRRDRCGHAEKVKFQAGRAAYTPGRRGEAADFDGRRFIDAGNVGNFGFYDKFSLAAWIYPRDGRGGAVLSRMGETPEGEGYQGLLEAGKLHLNLVKRWLDDALRLETDRTLSPGRWYHITVTYDGSRVARGVRVYIDGRTEKLKVHLDDLNQSFRSKEPLRIGSGGGPGSR